MSWHLFHQTAIGGSHRLAHLPCQDHAVSEDLGWARIVIVADGHGSRRHFRSERGSRLACTAALEAVKELLEALPEGESPSVLELETLKERILERWREAVFEDAAEDPWTWEELSEAASRMTEEELERLRGGAMSYVPYGSTLVAGFATDAFWAGVQIGDGFLVTMDGEGNYLWPMPESRINQGNRTASLCMGAPMAEFRHCLGTGPITGLAVCTDGIEKAFPPMGEKVARFLHWLWLAAQEEPEEAQPLLASYAQRVADRSAVKDDVGFAVMADTEAEDVPPHPTRQQLDRELHQAAAQLEELESVIDYTRRQLTGAASPGEAEQLQHVLDRRLAERSALQERVQENRAEGPEDPQTESGAPEAEPPALPAPAEAPEPGDLPD